MTVYIIASGAGTRMAPYNEVRPKCLLPVVNRPVIRWILDALPSVEPIKVITDRFATDIRGAVPDTVEVIKTPELGGSADALLAASDGRESLIIPGDVVVSESDLAAFAASPIGEEVQLLVTPIDAHERSDWIGVQLRDDVVVAILGHPRDETTHRIVAAKLPKGFDRWLERTPSHFPAVEVGMMPPEERQIESAVELFRQSGGVVRAVETTSLAFDLDKPWHILAANEDLLRRSAGSLTAHDLDKDAIIDSGASIEGYVRLGRGSRIGSHVTIRGNVIAGENVVIDSGAILNGTVAIGDGSEVRNGCFIEDGSVIGRDCVVSHAAELAGVLFDGVYLYHYMEIYGIVGTNTDIGAATVCGSLRFDDGETTHRIKGRREVPSNHSNASFIGDYCRTGVNAILQPGHRIGPYSIVGPGVILDRDVAPRTGVRVSQELKEFSWGPERYGW